MKALILSIIVVFCLFPIIGCGGAPEKTIDHDQLDRNSDRAHRDLDRQ